MAALAGADLGPETGHRSGGFRSAGAAAQPAGAHQHQGCPAGRSGAGFGDGHPRQRPAPPTARSLGRPLCGLQPGLQVVRWVLISKAQKVLRLHKQALLRPVEESSVHCF